MRVWDDSVVLEKEIDTLGHMNVRFYLQRAYRASERALDELGVGRAARETTGAAIHRSAVYSRYEREQRLGAPLQVRGGLLDADDQRLRFFFEVRNPQTDEVAALFIPEFSLGDVATRSRRPWPPSVAAAAPDLTTALPAYGAPRSVSLSQPRRDVTFADVLSKVGEDGDGGPGALTERTVPFELCDEHGFLREDAMMFMAPDEANARNGKTFGPEVTVNPEGVRTGWALMEMRAVQFERLQGGDVLRSIGAIIALERKVRRSRKWVFNAKTGALVSIDDTVALMLDVDARRAVEIPHSLREALAGRHAPELA